MSVDNLLEQAIISFWAEINTCLPGKVISFDGTRAVVKPALDKLFADGRVCDAPEIISVPVVFPCGKTWRMGGPLFEGDGVVLFFSQRALEAWLDSGDRVPNDPRMFSVSDAIAIPGLNPASYYAANKQLVDTENFFIQMGAAVMQMTPGGNIKLTANGKVDLDAPAVNVSNNLTVGNGASGVFTTTTGLTVVVSDGIILSIG